MAIVGHWSKYAGLNALKWAEARTPATAPTAYEAALYDDSANPDSGTSTESTLTSYARVTGIGFTHNDALVNFENTASFSWTGLGPGNIGGLSIIDSGTGNVLWWVNFTALYANPSGGGVFVPAAGFIVSGV